MSSASFIFVSSFPVAPYPSASSRVVPVFPALWWSWGGWVSSEKFGKEPAEVDVRLAFGKEFGDSVESDDPCKGLDKYPDIRQRRRAFHTV